MGEFSPIHLLLILLVFLLLFGGKKIPEMMRGLGEGIRSFKEGIKAGEQPPVAAAPPAPVAPAAPANPTPPGSETKQ
jgi:sec-independent protein translocase protein TatA